MPHTASPAYKRMLLIAHDVYSVATGMYHPAVASKNSCGAELEFREGDNGFVIVIDVTPHPANLRATAYYLQEAPRSTEEAAKLKDPIYQGFLFASGQLVLNDNQLRERALNQLGKIVDQGLKAVGATRAPTEAPATRDTDPPS